MLDQRWVSFSFIVVFIVAMGIAFEYLLVPVITQPVLSAWEQYASILGIILLMFGLVFAVQHGSKVISALLIFLLVFCAYNVYSTSGTFSGFGLYESGGTIGDRPFWVDGNKTGGGGDYGILTYYYFFHGDGLKFPNGTAMRLNTYEDQPKYCLETKRLTIFPSSWDYVADVSKLNVTTGTNVTVIGGGWRTINFTKVTYTIIPDNTSMGAINDIGKVGDEFTRGTKKIETSLYQNPWTVPDIKIPLIAITFIACALLTLLDWGFGLLGMSALAFILAVKRLFWMLDPSRNPANLVKDIPIVGDIAVFFGTVMQWVVGVIAAAVTFLFFLIPGLCGVIFGKLLDMTAGGVFPPVILMVKKAAKTMRAKGKAKVKKEMAPIKARLQKAKRKTTEKAKGLLSRLKP